MTTLRENVINISKENVSWKTHNNVKYLSVNFSGLDSIEILETVKNMRDLMNSEPEKSIRYFLNTEGATLSFSTVMMLKKFSSSMQSKILKSGFSGVTGPILPLFNIYKSFTNTQALLFKTQEEALDYICS